MKQNSIKRCSMCKKAESKTIKLIHTTDKLDLCPKCRAIFDEIHQMIDEDEIIDQMFDNSTFDSYNDESEQFYASEYNSLLKEEGLIPPVITNTNTYSYEKENSVSFDDFKVEFLNNACKCYANDITKEQLKTVVHDTTINNFTGDLQSAAFVHSLNRCLHEMLIFGCAGVLPTLDTAIQVNRCICESTFKMFPAYYIADSSSNYVSKSEFGIDEMGKTLLESLISELTKTDNEDEIIHAAADLLEAFIMVEPFEKFNDITAYIIVSYYLLANKCMPIIFEKSEFSSLSCIAENYPVSESSEKLESYIWKKVNETYELIKEE